MMALRKAVRIFLGLVAELADLVELRVGGDDQPPAERRATDLEARDRRLVVGDETILRELDEGVEVRVVSVDVQSHDITPLKG